MLTSLQNPLVKQLRKLHHPKSRKEHQLFLLEGTHLLEEALAVNYPLAVVCYTPEWEAHHPTLTQHLAARVERLELVSSDVLQAIATTVHPDGIIAAAHRRSALLPHPASLSLGVALETIQDPGNLGTIIRTAAAVGGDGLWLNSNSVDLDHPKVLRATAGQWFRLPMTMSEDLQADIRHFQGMGVQVVATLPEADRSYWDIDLCPPSLILVGNEGAGLSSGLAEMADIQVKIPLAEGVESLNAAIATALLLYEARRQRTSRSRPQ